MQLKFSIMVVLCFSVTWTSLLYPILQWLYETADQELEVNFETSFVDLK